MQCFSIILNDNIKKEEDVNKNEIHFTKIKKMN